MKKPVKIILISSLIVVFVGLTVLSIETAKIIVGLIQESYITDYKITDVGTEASPDGTYEVLFQQVGQPNFPGDAKVKITVKDLANNEVLETIESYVCDDGGPLDATNWEVTWNDGSVSILLKSDEHPNQYYEVLLNR